MNVPWSMTEQNSHACPVKTLECPIVTDRELRWYRGIDRPCVNRDVFYFIGKEERK
jgi:hypothetical protein